MTPYPFSVMTLIRHLSALPGIGEKTAERLAMHLVRTPARDAEALARSILHLKETIRLCQRCFGLSDADECAICANPVRDATVLCVVAQVAEMVAIERSAAFTGRYHVLQGVLSPADGIGPAELRIHELMQRIASEPVREVILATGSHLEGETTALYLTERLGPTGVCVTRIAEGVPVGGDLKYVDQLTLRKALEYRHECGRRTS